MENIQFNALFSEIIQSYSKLNHKTFGLIYYKHYSYSEAGDIESRYYDYLDEAKKNKILTYKEQEQYLLKENLWTEKDETEILLQEQFLDSIKLNYSKEYLDSRRRRIKKTIDDAEVKLQSIKLRKQSLMSKTAESHANQKILTHKISNSFYKDKKFTVNLIQEVDIQEEDYQELIEIFYKIQERFAVENLKKLSISGIFTNLFYLAEDNAYQFYGRPIIELTNFQVDLFMWGRYFKNIMQEQGSSIPQNVKNDPNKLIDWIDIRRNAKDARIIDDEKGGNMSIPGATKEDLEILGLQLSNNSNMKKKLKDAGGILTKDQIFEMEN